MLVISVFVHLCDPCAFFVAQNRIFFFFQLPRREKEEEPTIYFGSKLELSRTIFSLESSLPHAARCSNKP